MYDFTTVKLCLCTCWSLVRYIAGT